MVKYTYLVSAVADQMLGVVIVCHLVLVLKAVFTISYLLSLKDNFDVVWPERDLGEISLARLLIFYQSRFFFGHVNLELSVLHLESENRSHEAVDCEALFLDHDEVLVPVG